MTFDELPVRSWFVFQDPRVDLPVGACMKVQADLPDQAKYFVSLGTGVMRFLANRNVLVEPLSNLGYAHVAAGMASDLASDRTHFQLPTHAQGDNT